MEPDPPDPKELDPDEEQITERTLPPSEPPATERAAAPKAEPAPEEPAELVTAAPDPPEQPVAPADPQVELIVPGRESPGQWVQPEPIAPTGMFELPAWALWAVVALAGIYLGNFTMGVDVIPDNLPLVGNLDEVVALVVGQQAWVAVRQGASYLFKLKPPQRG
jgi:hypothetical protein